MLRIKPFGVCAVLAAALALSCVLAGETKVSTVEKRFPLNPGQPVSVSFRDSDGDITFRPGEDAEVVLKVYKETDIRDEARARRLMDEIAVEVSQQANDIRIEIRYPRSWGISFFHWGPPRVRVRSEVLLPKECRVEARTSDGDISVAGIKGSLLLRTSDGDIGLSGVEGRIEARASDGQLNLENVSGEIKASTSDGSIQVKGLLTVLDLKTSDGDISAEALPESRAAEDWILQASDGDINLALAPDFSAEVQVHTGDGDIDCRLPLTLQGKARSHELRGTLGQGGRLVVLKTSDGDITLKSLSAFDRKP